MTNNNNELVGIQINCRSINTKLGALKCLIYKTRPDFVLLSETWLKPNNANKLPNFVGYTAEWKHRTTLTTGGGLGILIKSDVYYQNVNLTRFPNGVLEFQCVKIFEKNRNSLLILSIYNPNKNITIPEFRHYIAQLGNRYILAGDFNAHSRILNDRTINPNITGKNIENLLLNDNICLINPYNFFTYVSSATFSRSCLDLCFTSANLAPLISMEQLPDIGSDHVPIKLTAQLTPSKSPIVFRKKWKTNNSNLEDFSNSIESSNVNQPTDTETLANDFRNRLHKAATETIGQTSGKPRYAKRTVWWNAICSKAVAEVRKARKLFENHPLQENADNYKLKLKEANKLIEKYKKESFEGFISSIHYNTPMKEISRKIRIIKGYKPESTSPIIHDNIIISCPKVISSILVNHYQTVSSLQSHKNIENIQTVLRSAIYSNDIKDYNNAITRDELKNALSSTKDKSPGEDEITFQLIRALKKENFQELLHLYNQCFSTITFPNSWKSGLIIPIKKMNKPPEDVSSYRPITLLSCIGKLFEKIIQKRLEYVLEKNNLLNEGQCGFRRGLGTIDILLRIENIIRQSLEQNKICIVVYIDLQSAFDTVWGQGAIYKLAQLGLRGNLIGILNEFFKERKVSVLSRGVRSDYKNISAGTPQGSTLSPILFNIMLSDIPQDDHIQIHSYADDLTITSVGNNVYEAKYKLQNYLKTLEKWIEDWGMKINLQKSVLQYFTKKKISYPILKMKNAVIKYEKKHTLLGLVLDSPKLEFKEHIEYLVQDCNRRLNIMKSISSASWGASSKVLRNFYISYVRSKIDYGSTIYGSAKENLLKKLEVIQNKALRLILGARNTSPILSIQAEAYVPPLTLHRGYLHVKQLIKLKFKPKNHATSLYLQMNTMHTGNHPHNSFSHRCERWMHVISFGPINRRPSNIFSSVPSWNSLKEYINYENKHMINCTIFNAYIDENFFDYIKIYTDGSKIQNESEKSVGSDSYNDEIKNVTCWKLNSEHSVIASELFAIYKTLCNINDYTKNYVIFTDSLSSLQLIETNHINSSYNDIVNKIQLILHTQNSFTSVIIHWVKGHNNIQGNEIADRSANLAHKNNRSEVFHLTETEQISLLKLKCISHWKQYWEQSSNDSSSGQFLRTIDNRLSFNTSIFHLKNRKLQVTLNRLRIGHIGLNEYLHRFRMSNTNFCEQNSCLNTESPESIEHFLLLCPEFSTAREILRQKLSSEKINSFNIKTLLLGEEQYKLKYKFIALALFEYIESTARMQGPF